MKLALRCFAVALLLAAPLPAQATVPPCDPSSILLAAKPIKGVGEKTITAACPAFAAVIQSWYTTHASIIAAQAWTPAQLVAVITSGAIPVAPAPIPVPTPPAPIARPPAPIAKLDSASGFTTPNILSNASFESGWDGFTDWSGGKPPTGVTRDTTHASDGSWSVLRTWTPNPNGDDGAQFVSMMKGHVDHVWVRFYFRLTNHLTTVMKFARFYDDTFGGNFGGFGLGQGGRIFTFGFNQENSAIATWIGLQESQVIDGNWHSLEVDYWRNGDPSGFPSAAFWFDGKPQGMPDGHDVEYWGAGNKSYWQGGRLYAGERKSSVQMFMMEWLATLNAGNTTSGQINLDRVAISTVGRIGP